MKLTVNDLKKMRNSAWNIYQRYQATMAGQLNDDIVLNGIKGVQGILDMIKDTIDNGDTEDAKMWISELQNELIENNVRS